MASTAALKTDGERFTLARRVYLYGISLISFLAVLFALDNLIGVLDDVWFGSQGIASVRTVAYARDAIAGSGGVLLVATPIFLLHWAFAQRRQDDAGERTSAWRKFFLYVASGFAVGFALVRGYNLLQGITLLALGEPVLESEIWYSGWLHAVVVVLIGVLLQGYFRRVALLDGDYGTEPGRGGTIRRLYQMIAGLVALGMMLFGCSTLLETAWRTLILQGYGTAWWRNTLADGLTWVLLGGVLAQFNWRRWRAITAENPQEAQAALRRFYLYIALIASALAALVPGANLLRELLLLAFGVSSVGASDLLDGLSTPVSWMPVGLVAWVWYARFLNQEAAQYGESPQAATVRRLYFYSVAATGLAVAWFGAVDLIQAMIGLSFERTQGLSVGGNFWMEPLANGLSLLAVGAPIWAYHWRSAQRIARQTDAEGQAERSSGPRKVYLYGVALASTLLILVFLAGVVYRALLWLLGDTSASIFDIGSAGDIARSALAALLWVVHVQAIRTDGQMGADVPEPPAESGPIVTDVASQRALLLARIEQLEAELAAARGELAKLRQIDE